MSALECRTAPVSARSLGVLLLTVGGTLLAAGCSQASPPNSPVPATPSEPEATLPALVGSSGDLPQIEAPRRVGDRMVHRFSGAYRKGALIMTEEVIGRSGDELLVDYQVIEGRAPLHLRVRLSVQSESVISVAEVINGQEEPSTLAVYEALMAETTFAPDQNLGLSEKSQETCLVGTAELDCSLSRYQVAIGGRAATLSVARSDQLRRDLAGEITAVDGTILYKADLLEMKQGPQVPQSDQATAFSAVPDWAERE